MPPPDDTNHVVRPTLTTAPLPPTPRRTGPLLGHAKILASDDYLIWLERHREAGDLIRLQAGPRGLGWEVIFGLTPDAFRAIVTAGETMVSKGNRIYVELDQTLGTGLLTSAGERWRSQRRCLQPLFTPQHVRRYAGLITRHAVGLADEWAPGPAVRGLREDMQRLTLEIIGEALFGQDLRPLIQPLHEAFLVASDVAVSRGLSAVPAPRWVPTPRNRRLRRAEQRLYAVADEVIQRRTQGQRGDDLVSLLLAARDPSTGQRLSPAEVRDQVLVFLLAGHDTTATALTFALHLVGHHPDIQRRARREIHDVLGAREPDLDDVGQLDLIRRIFDESMRLYPPAYIVSRYAETDVELCGYRVPAGAIVAASVHHVHRDPNVWSDPGRFDPDRFLEERVAHRHPYAFVPFGGGPRSCIGNHFAYLEAVLILAVLLQRFTIHTEERSIPTRLAITQQIIEDAPARIQSIDLERDAELSRSL